GLLLRLFRHHDPQQFNLADPDRWIKMYSSLFGIAVLTVTTLVCRRNVDPEKNSDQLFALATMIVAATIASPVCWLHHLSALTLPFAVVANRLYSKPQYRTMGRDALLFLSFVLVSYFF